VNEDKTERTFTKTELEGMPEDFIFALRTSTRESDGATLYHVTMKYPDLIPTMKMAKREETRRVMDEANSTRCSENIPLLTEMVKLRRQAAHLLGYKNHADFKLEVKMAKTTPEVMKFLEDLVVLLKPLAEQELASLLALKKAEKETRGEPFDGKINSWDVNYYNRVLLETEHQVEDEKIKEYFSMEAVTTGMLELYEELFSIKCVEVPNAETWHPEVRLFEVFDASSNDLCGQFYLDLHPRDNKYGHAACFGLVPGHTRADGTRQFPVAAMVANFSKSTPERPSLLKHNEVVTYFHELG
jgi:Zn-dependent oligopeptidase